MLFRSVMRRIEHALPDGEINGLASLHAIDELGEDEEFPEIEDPP